MGIAGQNLQALYQRGQNLEDLEDRSNVLAGSAANFRRGANSARKRFWWKDTKMKICIVGGIVILLIIIIVPSGTSYCNDTYS